MSDVESIYIIQYNYWRDSYDGRPDFESDPYLDDYGFFLTEEAAQAKVDTLNNFESQYAKYVLDRETGNRKVQAEYDARKAKWDALVDTGIEASEYMKEPRLALSETKTFDEMVRLYESQGYYSVLRVERFDA